MAKQPKQQFTLPAEMPAPRLRIAGVIYENARALLMIVQRMVVDEKTNAPKASEFFTLRSTKTSELPGNVFTYGVAVTAAIMKQGLNTVVEIETDAGFVPVTTRPDKKERTKVRYFLNFVWLGQALRVDGALNQIDVADMNLKFNVLTGNFGTNNAPRPTLLAEDAVTK